MGRLADEYRRHAERLIARYPLADMSRLDYTVLRDLATQHPDASAHDLAEALRRGSPNVHDRKANDRYVDRTVATIAHEPPVLTACSHLSLMRAKYTSRPLTRPAQS